MLHNHLRLLGRAELALALVQLALQLVDAGLLDGHGFFACTDFLLLLSELGIFRGDHLKRLFLHLLELLHLSACATTLRANLEQVSGVALRGGDVTASLNHGENFWVNLYRHIMTVGKIDMSVINRRPHEVSELLPNDAEADVDDPLPGESWDVSRFGQVLLDSRVVGRKR